MSLRARVVRSRAAFTLDVDVRIGDGEVVAVLGPNGAGKTTLLRALAGLDPLSAGRVVLGERVLEDVAQQTRLAGADRGVGFVFADGRLFPHLSVRENVAFGPRSGGASRSAARLRAEVWLRRLGLTELADRRPGQLSGGQAQRAALARALATEPELLLLDEPLAALDPAGRDDVRLDLRDRMRAFAGPVLIVTHQLLDALVLADRVLVLEAGRVVQDATPVALTRRPLTPFVASAVGLTLLRGVASFGVLDVDPVSGGGRLPADPLLSGPALAAIAPGAVRLTAAADQDGDRRWRWPVRVGSLEARGDRIRVRLDGAPSVAADVDLATAARLRLTPGQQLTACLDPADVETYPTAPETPSTPVGRDSG